ncbi:hypothetical protein [Bradyrhizobium sp. WSM1417]|uniref:hypothetical protein n=1 Tax=Bradyrhizobium sp. WSM1417 TaxID=754500 RepID=UPI0012EB6EAB|nr:hypothetical protein [Bradyrhizobium sp. WSM1417]
MFYSEYSSCDDGGLADDLTERVVRLFNTHWSELHSLSAVTQKDQKFLKFVLSHIDSTADTADLSKLYKSAKQNCPANTALLCRQISDAAKKALN